MALSWERPERIKMSERACGEREEKAELSSRSVTSSRSKSASCRAGKVERSIACGLCHVPLTVVCLLRVLQTVNEDLAGNGRRAA